MLHLALFFIFKNAYFWTENVRAYVYLFVVNSGKFDRKNWGGGSSR